MLNTLYNTSIPHNPPQARITMPPARLRAAVECILTNLESAPRGEAQIVNATRGIDDTGLRGQAMIWLLQNFYLHKRPAAQRGAWWYGMAEDARWLLLGLRNTDTRPVLVGPPQHALPGALMVRGCLALVPVEHYRAMRQPSLAELMQRDAERDGDLTTLGDMWHGAI